MQKSGQRVAIMFRRYNIDIWRDPLQSVGGRNREVPCDEDTDTATECMDYLDTDKVAEC